MLNSIVVKAIISAISYNLKGGILMLKLFELASLTQSILLLHESKNSMFEYLKKKYFSYKCYLAYQVEVVSLISADYLD